MRTLLFIALSASSLLAQASTEQPTDAELGDWMTFLRSVSLPVTTEVCAPLLADKADYPAVATQWMQAHQAEIERGREFARAGMPEGRDFDKEHAAMAADFRAKLMAKPEATRLGMCSDSLNVLSKGLGTEGK